MFRYWIFNPVLWIQTDKGRLKTDKIPPHPCPLPATKINGERIKVRGGVSGVKPLKYVQIVIQQNWKNYF